MLVGVDLYQYISLLDNVIEKYIKENSTYEIIDVKNVDNYFVHFMKLNDIDAVIILDENNEVVRYISPVLFAYGRNRGEDIYVQSVFLNQKDYYIIICYNSVLDTIELKSDKNVYR